MSIAMVLQHHPKHMGYFISYHLLYTTSKTTMDGNGI